MGGGEVLWCISVTYMFSPELNQEQQQNPSHLCSLLTYGLLVGIRGSF